MAFNCEDNKIMKIVFIKIFVTGSFLKVKDRFLDLRDLFHAKECSARGRYKAPLLLQIFFIQ
jgi:hypothetical protein